MKRIAVVVVVLVVVVAVALPPLFGSRARSRIEAELGSIAESLAPYATVEVVFDDWDIGWFASTASVSLSVALTAGTELAVVLAELPTVFDAILPDAVTLHHGPVVTVPRLGVGWGSVEFVLDADGVPALQEFQDRIGADHVARAGVLVGLFDGARLDVSVPVFEYETRPLRAADSQAPNGELVSWSAQNLRFEFAGLDANASFDGDGESMGFEGESGGFSVVTPDAPLLDVGRIGWNGSIRRDARLPDLWLGGGRLDMARVRAVEGAGDTYEVGDLRLEGGSDTDGDLYVATGFYRAGEVRIGEIRLNDLVMDMAMRHSADAMARLIRAGYDADALSPQAEQELINAFFRERVTFDIDPLSFRHEDRSATAALAFEYRGDELPDTLDSDWAADPAALLPLVSVNLDLTFHRELLNGLAMADADSFARILAREGFIRESGDDYALTMGFDGVELTVNGSPFQPYELLQVLGPLGGISLGI